VKSIYGKRSGKLLFLFKPQGKSWRGLEENLNIRKPKNLILSFLNLPLPLTFALPYPTGKDFN